MTPKKIIVGGCTDCPYCQTIKSKDGYHFRCRVFLIHSTYFKKYGYKYPFGTSGPILILDEYIENGIVHPNWCPLPDEKELTTDDFKQIRTFGAGNLKNMMPMLDLMERTGHIIRVRK